MTTQTNGHAIPGLTAAADLSSSQFKIVKLASTAGQVVLASAGADASIGVLQNDPATGQEALVQFSGVAKVLAEASVTAGALVAASSTGRAKVTTTANNGVIGRAIDASANAGDLVRVLLSIHNL